MRAHIIFSLWHTYIMNKNSLNTKTLLDEVEVDLVAEGHAVLEGTLVVRLGTLGLDVLLDRVDLRLVLDQLLLYVIQTVVDVALQDLILFGVVFHGVIGHLLLEAGLVLLQEGADGGKTHLLTVKLDLEVVGARELVAHLILHLSDLLRHLLHLLLDSALECLDLLEVVLSLFELDLQPGVGGLGVLDLPLLERQLILLVLVLSRSWQIVLTNHCLLHVLEECRDGCLVVTDLLLVLGLFLFKALHELVDLALLLIQDFILLSLAVLSTSASATATGLLLLQVLLNLLDVPLIRLDHLSNISHVLFQLLDLRVVLLDPVEQALARLGERQVHLVSLQLQVVLALQQRRLLLFQVLRTLLQRVLLQP